MTTLLFLLLFPLLTGFTLIFAVKREPRTLLITSAGIILTLVTLSLLFFPVPTRFAIPETLTHLLSQGMMLMELLIAVFLLYLSVVHGKTLAVALNLAQTGVLIWFEFMYGSQIKVANPLVLDPFSIIMALLIGVTGSLIAMYAVGYMIEFHRHYRKEVRDKRNWFFFFLYVFLSAMFGIVFSNDLLWMHFFWEVTTLCSFLMIAYKETEEAFTNAFRALTFNLFGGLAFGLGIVFLYKSGGTIELDVMISLGQKGLVIPAMLLALAGLTKAAQLPFSSWLLGAMVAPTPVSALLHSSTMVKAGVFLILKMSPILQSTVPGLMVALIGGATFLWATFLAVTVSDAKGVLAYSTIANLGLIVLCGGIGTYESVWAGILLIMFHAVAKCLLFLCVGLIEHKVHSRDIEDMEGLVISMPHVSSLILIGMAGMFLAPFGMLIGKWAVLKALVDIHPLLAGAVVFGSSVTLFFWVKWMGKIITVIRFYDNLEEGISSQEWAAMYTLGALTVFACAFFPVTSTYLIEPYVTSLYGTSFHVSNGNVIIMLVMLGLVVLFPLSFSRYGKGVKVVDAYLGGANQGKNDTFQGSIENHMTVSLSNYYLRSHIDQDRLTRIGILLSHGLIIIMIIAGLYS